MLKRTLPHCGRLEPGTLSQGFGHDEAGPETLHVWQLPGEAYALVYRPHTEWWDRADSCEELGQTMTRSTLLSSQWTLDGNVSWALGLRTQPWCWGLPPRVTSLAFWSQEVQDQGHMSPKHATLQVPHSRWFWLRAGQAWLEGNLTPCLFYQHEVSMSVKEYPLLQEAILVTLAHYNLSSNFPGRRPSVCTRSTHLTVTAIPGTHLSFPIAVPLLLLFLPWCTPHHSLSPHAQSTEFTPPFSLETGPSNGGSLSEPSSGHWVSYAAAASVWLEFLVLCNVASASASPWVTLCSEVGKQLISPSIHHVYQVPTLCQALGWILGT